MKMGIDDFLAREAAWPREAYLGLERIPLTDDRFTAHHAWFQKWEAKQTEQDALKPRELDDVELTETAGVYVVRSPRHAVALTFNRLTESRGEHPCGTHGDARRHRTLLRHQYQFEVQ